MVELSPDRQLSRPRVNNSMHEDRQKLIRCFASVFPDLREADIQTATSSSVTAWDSVAMVTLIAVIEQEFGLQLPTEDLDELASFEKIWGCIQRGASIAG